MMGHPVRLDPGSITYVIAQHFTLFIPQVVFLPDFIASSFFGCNNN